MIENKLFKALTMFEGRNGRVAYFALLFATIFLLTVGILNLYLASRIGMREGYELLFLLKGWASGFKSSIQYSGVYLLALERMETAFLQFLFAILTGIYFIIFLNKRQRNREVIDLLKKHKEWPE